ncbi:MAG: hypothetical protein L3J74_14200, partial [Bacteroidales bacterium]|nr:hypothetical protein [Bacteroidales bacterium]
MKLNLFIFVLVFYTGNTLFAQQSFIINHTHTDLSQIPDYWIDSAQNKLKIMYFRRSHGSHIDVGGMAALRRYSSAYAAKYDYNETGSGGALKLMNQWHSVDFEPDTWYSITRAFLDDPANADINVVMWAWSSKFYISNVQAYLDTMEVFIADYGINGNKILDGTRSVPVTFIFQTATSQASDVANQIVYEQNQLIRQHCINNNRILFDFNDIETYNPDGEYFGDGNPDGSYSGLKRLDDDISYNLDVGGRGNWGIEWNNANPTSELAQLSADNICTVCEHSDQRENPDEDNSRLHCVLKGRAAWWLWAKLAGWGARSLQINTATALNEENINGQTISLTLTGESFVDTILSSNNFILNNAPVGLSIATINYIDANHADLLLTFDGTDFDIDVQNFNIRINAAELTSTLDIISNSINITAFDEQLLANENNPLIENNLDNGLIDLKLIETRFADNQFDINNFILNNAPAGTTIESVQYTDSANAVLNLAFDGTDFDIDVTDFSITIANQELTCTQDLSSNLLVINAINEEAAHLSLSVDTSLNESNLNGATIELLIHNDTFIDNQLAIANFELINQPQGCSIQQVDYLTDSTANCILSFDGTDFDENIVDFNIRILAAELSGSQNLEGDYLIISAIIETDETPAACLTSNDSLIEDYLNNAQLNIYLHAANFSSRLSNSDFQLNNAPQGLSISSVSAINDTSATITLAFDGTDISTDIENFSTTVLAYGNSSNTDLKTNSLKLLASTTTTTSTDAIIELESVNLYPNPNSGNFILNLQ